MKIIENSVEFIKDTIPGKKMEYCGRVCYNSADKITEDSHKKFITTIYKSGHLSVLEHERVVFKVDTAFLKSENFSKYHKITYDGVVGYVSANVRAWVENTNNESLFYPFLKELYPYIFEQECLTTKSLFIKVVNENEIPEEHKKYHISKTFKIIVSRGCTHQLVRHRVFSFSQQSQRYCNFSGEKYGHSINFIMPIVDDVKKFTEEQKLKIQNYLSSSFERSENEYFELIDNLGLRPEDARNVLPNAAASIIMMTGTIEQWKEFFKLRCDNHAQREIRDISNKIKELLNDKEID